jgi:TonB family protein
MAVVVMVKTVDPPPPPSVEDLRRVIERITPPKVEVPTIPVESTGPVVAGNGPGTEGKKEPKKGGGDKGDGDGGGGAPKGGGGKGKGGGGGAGPDRGAIRDAIAGKGILAMIGARGGGGGGGAVGSVFGAGGGVSDDVGSALAGTAGVGVYGGGGGDITRRGGGGGGGGGPGGGGGGAAGIGDLATSGGGSVDTGAKAAARIVARVSTDDTQAVDGGNFDKKAITAAIKRRQDAFQDCYQSALKQNSKLAGKIVVEFTIAEDGRVTDTRINKSTMGSAEVEKCLQGVLRRMRFPAQKEEVTLSNSFVFQASGS